MNDVMAAAEPIANLPILVQEAFIDPIRSVLIIDDRYPTWDTIFGKEGYERNDKRWAPPEQMHRVVQQFRDKSPALTVDIHDGGDNAEISRYLHQSDLLVLDYQLEPKEPYGIKASQILVKLLASTHFNLVVVHTDTDDLVTPFNTILLSLLSPIASDGSKVTMGSKLLEKAQEEGDWEDIEAEVEEAMREGSYLAYRRALDKNVSPSQFIDDYPEAAKFKAICEKAGWKAGECRLALYWALSKHETRMVKTDGKTQFRWSSPGESDHAWIRTSGGFIAFAKKQNTQLLDTLRDALADWKPSPSRMISSRIRAEISSLGVMAEDTTFSDRRAYWKYYQELLASDVTGEAGDSQRRTLIEAHAARHTERLLDKVGAKAVEFGLKLVKCDPTSSDPAAPGFASHYEVPPSAEGGTDLTINHYNAYISTKPVSGWHLQPGHLLKLGRELWVCASPACDLVPEQKTQIGITGSSKAKTKPFLAVKLHVRDDVGRADVNSNTMVFLLDEQKNEVATYSVFEKSGENASPVWRMMFADNFGKFKVQDKVADLGISVISGESGTLEVKPIKATIVGQLRYEYALNLINKLGIEFTRIGLDFVAPPDKAIATAIAAAIVEPVKDEAGLKDVAAVAG
ncbi:response regulator receiver domain [Rhizobium sp. SRDI969]|uniref:response regulator receiver domain n=1 Tax=Rhizobium sp. SRDI969 TaxID=3138252 RepID=UPI0021A8984C|nr:response regulator receiver domain [Rhizobium leguminosarum]UWM82133.1 response regulator receiver domain [Rhizobium leguminosarum bv. viciae]